VKLNTLLHNIKFKENEENNNIPLLWIVQIAIVSQKASKETATAKTTSTAMWCHSNSSRKPLRIPTSSPRQ
jgi:hypothetical protein